jgi:CRISPR-associated endonuclease/helicase Cas3
MPLATTSASCTGIVMATARSMHMQAPIIVPYGPAASEIADLVNGLRFARLPGAIARKLQPYVVQIPRRERKRLIDARAAEVIRPEEFGEQFVLLTNADLYGEQDGLDWVDPTSEHRK